MHLTPSWLAYIAERKIEPTSQIRMRRFVGLLQEYCHVLRS